MVQYQAALDVSFGALSDPTRRSILLRLGRAQASISDLAESFEMTLTGLKKHIGVLEAAGLVTSEKVGRVRKLASSARGDSMKQRSGSRRTAACSNNDSITSTNFSNAIKENHDYNN